MVPCQLVGVLSPVSQSVGGAFPAASAIFHLGEGPEEDTHDGKGPHPKDALFAIGGHTLEETNKYSC